jgi:fibronectin-binding protein B
VIPEILEFGDQLVEPVEPDKPDKLEIPDQPALMDLLVPLEQPEKPDKPDKPDILGPPEQPDKPVEPDKLVQLAIPETPDQQEKSALPVNLEKPVLVGNIIVTFSQRRRKVRSRILPKQLMECQSGLMQNRPQNSIMI